MLTIIIADDELAARRRLKRLLGSEPSVRVVGEFSDGRSAIEGIERLRPDVALLDIQMPERDGLEVAEAVIGPRAPAVVFVTAFDQYALRAFQVHAIDYLMKPVDPVRLHETLIRLQSRATELHPGAAEFARLTRMIEELRQANRVAEERRQPRERLLVAVDGRSLLVNTADLDWIEAAGNYVRLHRGANAMMMRESLASVEASLDRNVFARVHRSAIVNIAKIKEVQPWFSGAAIVILTTGQRLTVSRSYRKEFEARFGIQSVD